MTMSAINTLQYLLLICAVVSLLSDTLGQDILRYNTTHSDLNQKSSQLL